MPDRAWVPWDLRKALQVCLTSNHEVEDVAGNPAENGDSVGDWFSRDYAQRKAEYVGTGGAGSSDQMTYHTNVFGTMPAIRNDGNGKRFRVQNVPMRIHTMVAIVKLAASAGPGSLFFHDYSSYGNDGANLLLTGTNIINIFRRGNLGCQEKTSTSIEDGVARLVTAQVDDPSTEPQADHNRIWINGVLDGNLSVHQNGNPTDSSRTAALDIMGGGLGSGYWSLPGDLGALIMADGDISTADRQRLEGWVAHELEMQASILTAAHPYYSAPPTVSSPVPVTSTLRSTLQYPNQQLVTSRRLHGLRRLHGQSRLVAMGLHYDGSSSDNWYDTDDQRVKIKVRKAYTGEFQISFDATREDPGSGGGSFDRWTVLALDSSSSVIDTAPTVLWNVIGNKSGSNWAITRVRRKLEVPEGETDFTIEIDFSNNSAPTMKLDWRYVVVEEVPVGTAVEDEQTAPGGSYAEVDKP